MPQVDRRTVKARALRLRAAGAAALGARLSSLVGSTQTLLIEKSGFGRTPCFAPVRLTGTGNGGTFVRANITGKHDGALEAEPLAS
jgi:threonylcarbamoyladenosine tRNA methylthiotransferase MtaB